MLCPKLRSCKGTPCEPKIIQASEITFNSPRLPKTHTKKTGDGYTAVGDLTLHGVTKEVTLTGNFNGVTKDPWGNTRAGFTAEGKVNRKDFGMVWNKALDSGGLVVGDEVFIKLDIECIKAKS